MKRGSSPLWSQLEALDAVLELKIDGVEIERSLETRLKRKINGCIMKNQLEAYKGLMAVLNTLTS